MIHPTAEPPQGSPTPPSRPGPHWQPGQAAAPPYPTDAPPAKKRGRPLVIGLIVAGVLALCVGAGCIGVGAYYWSEVRVEPTTDAGAAPETCSVSTVEGEANRPIGMPDFDGAPRTGTATLNLETNLGRITITMDRAKTPCTVASVQHLAERAYYSGQACHRLTTEKSFVLECGDLSGTGRGGPDYRFADENLTGAKYTRGVVGMANDGRPNSNGSRYFIVFDDSPLPPTYTPFGTVTSGLEIVDHVAEGGHDNAYRSSAGGGVPRTELHVRNATVS
ncbi:peptidylprolyl isomerase [Plantactinospora sonchi]|uniref:Peptidylprolyl isomerase n=1 Tax=Plantactinospora sonchi TaxID=1544735 RepID=A0ABU7RMX2_9ACTN